jgi:hypothetical protein
MKPFKDAAESQGYQLWYDCRLKMWALTKEGVDTEYFDLYLLNQMGLEKFIKIYLNQ